MNKHILITGGAGFIGTNLSRKLLADGYRISVLDNLSPQIHGAYPQLDETMLRDGRIHFIRADVRQSGVLEQALQTVDTVVHLAAETGTAQSMYQIAHYNEVNTQATAQLLDILANKPNTVKKIVLASSRSIYGEGAYACPTHGTVYPGARSAAQLKNHQWDPLCPACNGPLRAIPTPETARPSPASIYAATKYAQEDLIRIAGDSLGISTAILRFQNVYGAGQSLNNPYTGILSIFSTRIRRGMSLPIFEDGLESRDFVHVNDIVQAIQLAMESDAASGATLNVGAGEPTSVLNIANLLVDALGGTVRPEVTGQYRLGDIRHCYADLSQIKATLNFTPQVSLARGIEEFAAWVSSQPLPEDGLDKANEELKKRKMMS
ncbi:SDR family NAD(P)-dependent oxidoreductase [Janthinobacterium sp. SUN026]|uniref:NAD-dependent epimerase/dehydratase family protein n=1 Tax=Janthinobacterium sp. SUN026 TaxID=3002438 RepID=UPI0025B254BC|nr:SDR family NAD(P)-dependent oxidoreductase [Janthinobacterium sp. SUN026]MDN2670283.1 SDR family NAD(P)-dependent oxidoreductase [Janthinobacterium sp. SUN026]